MALAVVLGAVMGPTVQGPPGAALAQAQSPSLPSVGELPDLSTVEPVPEAGQALDGVLQTVEQAGRDLGELTGQPSQEPEAAPPAAPNDAGASTDSSAAGAPPAPPAQVDSGRPSSDPDGAGATPPGRQGSADGGASGEPALAAAAADRKRDPAQSEPRSTRQQAPTGGFFSTFGELPWTLLFAAVALALLGLIMTGRSAGLAVRGKRLRIQRQELREDVGALQTALLPSVPEQIGGVGVSVAYEAAAGPAAGGDFHDILRLDDRRVAVIVGDVCGHGREALTITALVHYTVRAYLEAGLEPRDALRLADQAIGGKLGSDFATVVAAIYDSATSTLRYSVAGHPAPIIVGEREDHAVLTLTPPPIGVGPGTGTRQTEVAISPGSEICFVTDGLLEARPEEARLLGREGLVRLLAATPRPLAAEEVLARVGETATTADDLTACVLRPLAAAGDGSVTEELDLEPGDDGDRLSEFLTQFGLDPSGLERVLAAAGRGAHGTRLRLRRSPAGLAGWEILGADDAGDGAGLVAPDRFEPSVERLRGNGNGESAADHGVERTRDGAALGRASRA